MTSEFDGDEDAILVPGSLVLVDPGDQPASWLSGHLTFPSITWKRTEELLASSASISQKGS